MTYPPFCDILNVYYGREAFYIKVNAMMDVVNETTFIQDYLTACGVQDVETYLNPDKIKYDHFSAYDNMCMAAMVFTEHMVNGSKVGIVVD